MWLGEWPGNHDVPISKMIMPHTHCCTTFRGWNVMPFIASPICRSKYHWTYIGISVEKTAKSFLPPYLVSWRLKLDHATHNLWLVC